MEVFAGMAFLVWVAVLGVPISMAILAWSAYYRVKGIERAMWAIVSELRASRVEQLPDVDPAATRRALEVAAEGRHISLSMFGR